MPNVTFVTAPVPYKFIKPFPKLASSPISKPPFRIPFIASGWFGAGIAGGIAAFILDLLFPRSTAKSDLASVEAFLGYKPTGLITVNLGTPPNFTGGQIAGQLYSVTAYWKWQGETIEQSFPAFLTGLPGIITQVFITQGSATSDCRFTVWYDTPANPRTINSDFITRQFGKQFDMSSWRFAATNISNGLSPDSGGNRPNTGVTTAPAVSEIQVFKTPQPIAANNPAPAKVPTPNKIEKPQKVPPLVQPFTPIAYPELNPTPNNAPGTNPDTNLTPGQTTPNAAPGSNPGRTTSFISGATPSPATSPLPPGTQRTTNFPLFSTENRITTREPYVFPTRPEVRPLPFIPPIPAREPIEPITAEIKCTDLNNCMSGSSSPVGQANGKLDQLLALLQGADLFQGQTILNKVTENNNLLKSPIFGLEKIMDFLSTMQNFAKKAWEATRMDKVLNALNTFLILHNAAMLSRNLTGSLNDLLSAGLNNVISLIKNEEFDDININETVGNTVENVLKGMLGEETYTGVNETFNKYSRILNAAANIIHTTTSMMAGLAEGLKLMGQYTGKIGNALKKSGAVLENSYNWMSETFQVKTGRIGKIQSVIDGLESVENVTSDLVEVTENFREVQESIGTVQTEITNIKTEITAKETEKATTENNGKTSSQSPTIALSDLAKPSSGE